MPSHISHSLLAADTADDVSLFTATRASRGEARRALLSSILAVAAQGPDLFLHNHRRKPRGFRYGALLHRKGNAELLRSLAHAAREVAIQGERADDDALQSANYEHYDDLLVYAFGYMSHVWLDRLVHPYINVRAGWRGVPDSRTERPFMHAFLERLIDVQLLRHLRNQSVGAYDFAGRLPRNAAAFFRLRPSLVGAIRDALVSARTDDQLPRRVINALHDGFAFYRFTEAPSEQYFIEARARERAGRISSRWLSLVHPPEHLIPFDTLNLAHQGWTHPCSPETHSSDSVVDRYQAARSATAESWRHWYEFVVSGEESAAQRFVDHVGPWNLNDGISEDPPLRRIVARPLPLLELYDSIKTHFER